MRTPRTIFIALIICATGCVSRGPDVANEVPSHWTTSSPPMTFRSDASGDFALELNKAIQTVDADLSTRVVTKSITVSGRAMWQPMWPNPIVEDKLVIDHAVLADGRDIAEFSRVRQQGQESYDERRDPGFWSARSEGLWRGVGCVFQNLPEGIRGPIQNMKGHLEIVKAETTASATFELGAPLGTSIVAEGWRATIVRISDDQDAIRIALEIVHPEHAPSQPGRNDAPLILTPTLIDAAGKTNPGYGRSGASLTRAIPGGRRVEMEIPKRAGGRPEDEKFVAVAVRFDFVTRATQIHVPFEIRGLPFFE